jgi:hypothetical protein
VVVQQALHRRAPEQRDIPRQDDNRSAESVQTLLCLQNGVPCPELLRLQHAFDVAVGFPKVRFDGLRLIPDYDDHAPGIELVGDPAE